MRQGSNLDFADNMVLLSQKVAHMHQKIKNNIKIKVNITVDEDKYLQFKSVLCYGSRPGDLPVR